MKYFDEVLIPRLDYARGKGAFMVNMTLLGLRRLGLTVRRMQPVITLPTLRILASATQSCPEWTR